MAARQSAASMNGLRERMTGRGGRSRILSTGRPPSPSSMGSSMTRNGIAPRSVPRLHSSREVSGVFTSVCRSVTLVFLLVLAAGCSFETYGVDTYLVDRGLDLTDVIDFKLGA